MKKHPLSNGTIKRKIAQAFQMHTPGRYCVGRIRKANRHTVLPEFPSRLHKDMPNLDGRNDPRWMSTGDLTTKFKAEPLD